ncbi:MAG: hypothetical protein MK188_01475 [Gammaproteobacteria bacterium]|nr:hypothetical protein [Gammaproteobacteria bacterium]
MLEKFFKTRPNFSVKDDLNTRVSKQFAPNTKIAYNPNLISVLESEHRNLTELYGKASMAANAGIQHKSRLLFLEFKDRFIDNVLRQNISLYIYLQHAARPGKDRQVVTKVKAEMDMIIREITHFLDYSLDEGTQYDDEFLARMEKVAKKIKQRTYTEESHVYPIYKRYGSNRKNLI